jgi:hypothetical protein
VNAVELAGSGRVSDVAGRATLAKDADLFMLAPEGAEKLWALARLSSGAGEASFELAKGHRAKRGGAEIAFPLRDVRDAILGSPETARKWILGVAGDLAWDDVVGLVPESLRGRLISVTDAVPGCAGPTPAERLTAALETARKRVRDANAEAKARRTVTAPPEPPPTDTQVAELEATIQTWRTQEGRANARAHLDSLRAQAAEARAAVETARSRIAGLERDLAAIPAPLGGQDVLEAAVLVAEAMVRAASTACGLCGSPVRPNEMSARAQRGRAKIREAVKVAKTRSDLEFALRQEQIFFATAERDAARLEKAVEQASRLAGMDEAGLPEMDLGTAEVRLRNAFAVRAGWAVARRAEEGALEAERESQEWDQLADALSKVVGVLVEKARKAFEGRVQRFLPREDLFGIELLDGDREVLRVGLRRLQGDRMVLHPAMSGAEWARVTAALALATAPTSGPCVIAPEERAFDPKTLAAVLRAWDEALGDNEDAPQLVVTSPIEPESVPLGWHVIQLGAEAAQVREPQVEPPKKKRGRPVTFRRNGDHLEEVPNDPEPPPGDPSSDLFS